MRCIWELVRDEKTNISIYTPNTHISSVEVDDAKQKSQAQRTQITNHVLCIRYLNSTNSFECGSTDNLSYHRII